MKEMNASGLVVANGVREKAEWTSEQLKKSKNIGSSVIDLVCVAWEVWYAWGGMRVWDTVEAGLQADHRMVTGTLKTRKKEGRKRVRRKRGDEDKGLELLGGFGRGE